MRTPRRSGLSRWAISRKRSTRSSAIEPSRPIKEADATSSGEIEEIFVQSLDEDEASVFAVVTETITNATTTEPRTDTLRLEVGLIETGSGWKVQSVEVFQSPGQTLLPGASPSP